MVAFRFAVMDDDHDSGSGDQPGGSDGDGLLVAQGPEPDVLGLRGDARALAAAEAKRLRRVVAIAERCTRETMSVLALGVGWRARSRTPSW